jgi:hypothetical protein
VVVREVVEVDIEEVVVVTGARAGGGEGGVVVGGFVVVVRSVGLGISEVSTRMTSLSAPAPTEVPLTNELPVKLSVQL